MPYNHRLLESVLFTAFEGPFITGLLGSRRVGKSTFSGFWFDEDLTVKVESKPS